MDKIKLLVVDDIAETRKDIVRLLYFENDMVVVGEAVDGIDALKKMGELQPDVVLMDINMPQMDGITAAERASNLYPNIAVVIISIQGESEYLKKAMIAGARDYLVKPIGSDEMANTIRSVHNQVQMRKSRVDQEAPTVTQQPDTQAQSYPKYENPAKQIPPYHAPLNPATLEEQIPTPRQTFQHKEPVFPEQNHSREEQRLQSKNSLQKRVQALYQKQEGFSSQSNHEEYRGQQSHQYDAGLYYKQREPQINEDEFHPIFSSPRDYAETAVPVTPAFRETEYQRQPLFPGVPQVGYDVESSLQPQVGMPQQAHTPEKLQEIFPQHQESMMQHESPQMEPEKEKLEPQGPQQTRDQIKQAPDESALQKEEQAQLWQPARIEKKDEPGTVYDHSPQRLVDVESSLQPQVGMPQQAHTPENLQEIFPQHQESMTQQEFPQTEPEKEKLEPQGPQQTRDQIKQTPDESSLQKEEQAQLWQPARIEKKDEPGTVYDHSPQGLVDVESSLQPQVGMPQQAHTPENLQQIFPQHQESMTQHESPQTEPEKENVQPQSPQQMRDQIKQTPDESALQKEEQAQSRQPARKEKKDATVAVPNHSPLGLVNVIFCGKGGVGKTTIATNLAVVLAQQEKKKVALVDLDLQFGDISVLLNLSDGQNISDLVDSDEITEELLENYMIRHFSGIDILPAPLFPQDAEYITPEHTDKILQLLKKNYDYVIVDTAGTFNEINLKAMDLADQILLVTTRDIVTIKNTKTSLNILESLDYREKIRIVLNRSDSDLGVEVADLEKGLEITVSHQIASDEKAAISSINKGVPVVVSHVNSEVTKSFKRLCDRMIHGNKHSAKTKQNKSIITRMFSL